MREPPRRRPHAPRSGVSREERRRRREHAEPLYRLFCDALAREDVRVATGRFGARMLVEIENDGPVTIVLDG